MKMFWCVLMFFVAVTAAQAQELQVPVDSTPDREFVYRLPFAKGVSAETSSLSSVEAHHYNATDLVDFKCWRFTFDTQTDVYAARKGTVLNVSQDRIVAVHADGTVAVYMNLEKDSQTVKEGDVVLPDNIIGRSGKDDNGGYSVDFELYYRTSNPTPRAKSANSSQLRRYIDPIFATTNGKCRLEDGSEYSPRVTRKLIYTEERKRCRIFGINK